MEFKQQKANGQLSEYDPADEISLRELIQIFIDRKKMIIVTTAVVFGLTALYSLVVLQPEYESRALVVVNFPETVETPYGIFTYPSRDVKEYIEMVKGPEAIDMTVNALEGSATRQQVYNGIQVQDANNTNTFRIVARAGDPETAYQLASVHTESYFTYLRIIMKRIATEVFYEETLSRTNRLEKELETIQGNRVAVQEVLGDIPPTITMENALISQSDYALFYSASSGTELEEMAGDRILSQVINPAYEQVQENVYTLFLQEETLVSELAMSHRNLAELTKERSALQTYAQTYDESVLTAGSLELTATGVSILNRPMKNTGKVSPNHGLNLAIGLVLGLMLGIFGAFFRAYWESNDPTQ